MSEAAKHILSEALKLDLAERAVLAAELLASLDGESEADVAEAWAAEVERRIKQIQAGTASGRAWSEVREEIAKRRG